jgi:hypothetical protein
MHGFGARTIVVIAAASLLGACGSATAPTAIPATGGGGSTSGSAATNSSAGGNVSSIKACSLLTPADIQSALGVAMKDGVEQDSDGQVECDWNPKDDDTGPAVSVSVATYDDAVWQTLSHGENATPIGGFGDAAYTGFPHQGDIAIKVKGFEVDLGIVDFTDPAAKIDAADKSLAQLVLGRLP